jgi:hypothetical protein
MICCSNSVASSSAKTDGVEEGTLANFLSFTRARINRVEHRDCL